MNKITSLLLLALALGLSGCASPPSQYGNFIQESEFDQQKLAADVVQQLSTLHLPARTHLALQQPTPDPFGQALVKSLRDKGYSLLEFSTDTPNAQAAPGSLPLRYVLDQDAKSSLYRLTLIVGDQTISRPYQGQNGTFLPAGYWARSN